MKLPHIVMIGAFPPPIHGMAVVNNAVLDQLKSVGAIPLAIDVAAPDIDRRLIVRLNRLPKVFYALVCLTIKNLKGGKLYMSVSGQLGQIYEILFASLARLRGMSLIMHHHSFAYLDKRNPYTQILINIAGSSAIHIALSEQMAKRLRIMYKALQTVSVSNAVFCFHNKAPVKKSRNKLRTIGFISNISVEKGIFEFLDLMTAIETEKLPLQAQIAGPFQDSHVEHTVYLRLAQLKKVEYVGPKYGADKDDFFDAIDVILFPTHYVNEAEPLVVLEALSRGVPVITYDRGCIPEIVGTNCGKIVDNTSSDFIPAALGQLKAWLYNPTSFEVASLAAARRFLKIYAQNNKKWMELLTSLIGGDFGTSIRISKI